MKRFVMFLMTIAAILCICVPVEICAFPVIQGEAYIFSSLRVYPNPFKSKLGHTKVTFENFPSGSAIKIFNATGKLIWEKETAGATKYDWYVNNLSSQKIAGGIYMYVIISPDAKTASGKIAVVR